MLPRIAFDQIDFGQPDYLWLLIVPGLLLLLWLWHVPEKKTPPSAKKEGQ